jgi:hypothetical protein
MPRLNIGEYRPDLDDNLSPYTRTLLNVLPRSDGYAPFPGISVLTSTLPAACRGYFYARNGDGSVAVFAGTATKLYKLNGIDLTWVDVSKGGGSYSGLPSTDQWQFGQFNNLVFATQVGTVLQVIDLSGPTAFADALGSPPQARYIAVVGRFLVLTGISNQAYRVQWSGLNNVNSSTSWDNVTAQSNYQDLADGGLTRGIGGGETGLITQDAALRRMTYAPGDPVIFQITRISEEKGIFAPLSLTRSGDRLFWLGVDGLKMLAPGGYPVPIGKDKVDATLFADMDQSSLRLCIGASDPSATRWYLAYKSKAGQAGLFDKLLCYDWALERFAPIQISGEYLATLARPGLTLENLDAIAPTPLNILGAAATPGGSIYGAGKVRLTLDTLTNANFTVGGQNTITVYDVVGTTEINGTWVAYAVVDPTHLDINVNFVNAYVSGGHVGGSLDALPFSLDDISTAALTQLSVFNSSHTLGFFSGPNLEAIVETAEQAIDTEGHRVFVRGFRPISDAPALFGSISTRSNLRAASTYTSESALNALGICPQRKSTRYARARMRIPAGTMWTIVKAVEPDFVREGMQ